MSPLLPIVVLLLWTSWTPGLMSPLLPPVWGSAMTLGVLGAGALLVMWRGRWIAARTSDPGRLHRFEKWLHRLRWMLVLWFGIGVHLLGWGHAVWHIMPGVFDAELRLLPLLFGATPMLITLVALWLAQYPAERTLIQHDMMVRSERGEPIFLPPSLRQFLVNQLRVQVLFALAPVLAVLALHDVLRLVFGESLSADQWSLLVLPLAVVVMLFGPGLLVRVVETERLADSPLRTRLEAMCQRLGLRYRDILLWRTSNYMGNAAVLGLIPSMRYVLMSDLLLASMDDDEIEAVFAHELGHVVHRHLLWIVLFVATLLLLLAGPIGLVMDGLFNWIGLPDALAFGTMIVFAMAMLYLGFGYFSRKLERQADVFAARTLETALAQRVDVATTDPASPPPQTEAHSGPLQRTVGPYGVRVFASALEGVARMNRIDPERHEWRHGSIQGRVDYLRELAREPRKTFEFDRTMRTLFLTTLMMTLACGAWTATTIVIELARPQPEATAPEPPRRGVEEFAIKPWQESS